MLPFSNMNETSKGLNAALKTVNDIEDLGKVENYNMTLKIYT